MVNVYRDVRPLRRDAHLAAAMLPHQSYIWSFYPSGSPELRAM
jgi:hypothetical protein